MPFGVPLMVPMLPDAVDILYDMPWSRRDLVSAVRFSYLHLGRRARGRSKQTKKGFVATRAQRGHEP